MGIKNDLKSVVNLYCRSDSLDEFIINLRKELDFLRHGQSDLSQFAMQMDNMIDFFDVSVVQRDMLLESLAEIAREYAWLENPRKQYFNKFDAIARQYGVESVTRMYDMRIKKSGNVHELKIYPEKRIQVSSEYKTVLQNRREAERKNHGWASAAEQDLNPDGEQLTLYNYAFKCNDNKRLKGHRKNVRDCKTRANIAVLDLMLSNPWEYFITLTFDPAKYDTNNPYAVYACLREWTKRVRRKFKDFRYLVCPDWKSEAQGIHFHGVILGVTREQLQLSHAVNPYTGRKMYTDNTNLPIYNIGSFDYGYTTLTEIMDLTRCAGYMTKYITKGGRLMPWYYYVSDKMQRPVCEYIDSERVDVSDLVNLFADESEYSKISENFVLWVRKNAVVQNCVDKTALDCAKPVFPKNCEH